MAKKNQDPGFGEFGEADVIKSTFLDGVTFYSKPILYTEVDGLALFEGDIILGTAQEVDQKTEIRKQELRGEIAMGLAITGDQYRWPNGIVPYTINSNLPNQARVTDAIAHWEANTRFRFVLRTNENSASHPDWVEFRSSTGCSSYVGRQNIGMQPINLAAGCSTGNAIHEIGHTLGLWHEHSREDRDSMVTIHWDKIIPGREHNFNQHIADGDDIGPYDYGSIMHYPRTAFSTDGSETITPTDPSAVIGQRTALSPGDIAAANSICLAPQVVCPPAPLEIRCPPAPVQRICPPSPIQLRCPPAPIQRLCPPSPLQPLCPPAPAVRCPPAPAPRCPPAPIVVRCPAAPAIRCPPAPAVRCPPAPAVYCPPAPALTCPPAAGPVGCAAGPYMRPGPRVPVVRRPQRPGMVAPRPQIRSRVQDPYAYGDPYGYGYGSGAYEAPAYYGGQEMDWSAYEYYDPYAAYYGSDYEYEGDFDPDYYY